MRLYQVIREYFLGVAMVLISIYITPVHASTNERVWTSYGVEQCKTVTKITRNLKFEGNRIIPTPEVWKLIGWVSGFATAVNSAIGSPENYYKAMSQDEILLWVKGFCRENPEKDLDYAMRLLATTYVNF